LPYCQHTNLTYSVSSFVSFSNPPAKVITTQPVWSDAGKKETATANIDIGGGATPKTFPNLSGFNGPVKFVWTTSGFGDSGLNNDKYKIKVKRGDANLYDTGELSGNKNSAIPSDSLGDDTMRNLDYEVEFDCTNTGLNICRGTFSWSLVDCGCPPFEEVSTPCTNGGVGSATAAICAPIEAPVSTAEIFGEWEFTGKSGNTVSFQTRVGTSTTEGRSVTEEQATSITKSISLSVSYKQPVGVNAEATVGLSGTTSEKVASQVSSSLTKSSTDVSTFGCPDTSASSTGLWFLNQWVMTQAADGQGGVGFSSKTTNFVCNESIEQVPRCPVGYCADSTCQTCLTPWEELSAPTAGTPTDGGGICFSGHSIVQVQGKGDVPMMYLSIGDSVAQVGGGFSHVYSFGHKHETTKTKYLQIQTVTMNKNQPLEISEEHLITARRDGAKKLVPAADLKVGEYLMAQDGSFSQIISLKTVERVGAYSPLTASGSLVVNGVEASSYVSRNWLKDRISGEMLYYLQHAGVFPVRVYCYMIGGCEQETYNDKTGFNAWVQFWSNLELWQLQVGGIVQAIFLSVAIVPMALLVLLGKVMSMPVSVITAHVLVALLGYLVLSKTKKACIVNQVKKPEAKATF